jgi:predicted nucleic acid-binding Zn ribbon protein
LSAPNSSVNFLCKNCDARLARVPGEPAHPCEQCGAVNDVVAPPADAIIERCAACGHDQLYFQKDFNRTTGIALVVLGSIFVPWTYGLSLLGVTILDYIVWRLVKNVIVCYRCQAVHRGYAQNPAIKPFDLVVHDRHVYGAAPPGAEEGHS